MSDAQGFGLYLAGRRIPVVSGRVLRAVDQLAWTWAVEIAWEPGRDTALDALVTPYAYPPAEIQLDEERVLTGYLYTVTPHKATDGSTLTIEGASLTAELVDSCIPADQWKDQWDKLSVWNLCNQIVPPMGIKVWTDLNQANLPLCVEPFDTIQHDPTDTFAELITRLAFQRGMLVTTNRNGDLALMVAHTRDATWVAKDDWQYKKPGIPDAILIQGHPPVQSWEAEFDGRRRFGQYIAIGQDDMGESVIGTATDAAVPARRRLRFTAGDSSAGTIGKTAEWRRSMTMAECLTIKLVVEGWTPPHSSQLWLPNTLVTVKAPSLFLAEPVVLLLRGVEHILDGSGRTAALTLVPQETYTGGAIHETWSTVARRTPAIVEGGIET